MRVRNRIDRTGQRYGRLVVLSAAPDRQFHSRRHGVAQWHCRCDCGAETVVLSASLGSGHTRSCGCMVIDAAVARLTRHGLADTLEYSAWQQMIARCEDERNPAYRDYGARGVNVCDRWHDFGAFIGDMGRRPSDQHSIDRFPDTNGNYEPANCRWATDIEQANNKRNTVRVIWRGRLLTLRELSEASGINLPAIQSRYQRGKRGEELTSPLQIRPSHYGASPPYTRPAFNLARQTS